MAGATHLVPWADEVAAWRIEAEALARRELAAWGFHLDDHEDDEQRAMVTMLADAMIFGRRIERAGQAGMRLCRVCGCSEHDACVGQTGDRSDKPEPCSWVDADLCSACDPYVLPIDRPVGAMASAPGDPRDLTSIHQRPRPDQVRPRKPRKD